jgi:PIN domain nuclease of toxin-antitoxin system
MKLPLDTPAFIKDPFDRMLIAQANAEGASLVSHDPIFRQYQARLAW